MVAAGDNGQLAAIIERIERLEAEKAQTAEDIREIYAEAKDNGFDTKAMRAIVKRRAADADKLADHEALVEVYMHALGMISDLPLGQAAMRRDGVIAS